MVEPELYFHCMRACTALLWQSNPTASHAPVNRWFTNQPGGLLCTCTSQPAPFTPTCCPAGQSVDAAVQLWLNKAPPAATATAPADHASLAASAAAVTAGGGADAGNSGMAAASSAALLYRLADKLRGAAEPLYMQLLLSVSQHRSGIAFLVGMRADLLVLLRAPAAELQQQGPALRALDQDIR